MMLKNNQGIRVRLFATVVAIAAALALTACQDSPDPVISALSPETSQSTESTTEQTTEVTEMQPADESVALAGYGAKGALADDDLNLVEMLAYALQDEYLAHAEYEAIIGLYGEIRPYTSIIKSEEQHIEALTTLYDAYGLRIPDDDGLDHVVMPDSLLTAAQTGVQAEIDNIAMYEKFLAEELPDDIRETFSQLLKASENHLAAFENQVRRLE